MFLCSPPTSAGGGLEGVPALQPWGLWWRAQLCVLVAGGGVILLSSCLLAKLRVPLASMRVALGLTPPPPVNLCSSLSLSVPSLPACSVLVSFSQLQTRVCAPLSDWAYSLGSPQSSGAGTGRQETPTPPPQPGRGGGGDEAAVSMSARTGRLNYSEDSGSRPCWTSSRNTEDAQN